MPLAFMLAVGPVALLVAIYFTLVPAEAGPSLRNHAGATVGNDFAAFYAAALMASLGEARKAFDIEAFFPLMRQVVGHELRLPWSYPPTMLLLTLPLALLPYLAALYAWIGGTSLLFAAALRHVGGGWRNTLCAMPPLVHNLAVGQNGALSAGLIAGGLLLLPTRPVLAGATMGLLAFKPQVTVLIPLCLAAAGQWRAFTAMGFTGSAMVLGSMLVFGVETWLAFFDAIPKQLAFTTAGEVNHHMRMPTVLSLCLSLGVGAEAARLMQVVVGLAAAGAAALVWRRTDALLPRSMALVAAMPLATPYLMEYDLAIAALPAVLLIAAAWRRPLGLLEWAALAMLWALPTLLWVASAGSGLQVGPLLFAVLLCIALRLGCAAPPVRA